MRHKPTTRTYRRSRRQAQQIAVAVGDAGHPSPAPAGLAHRSADSTAGHARRARDAVIVATTAGGDTMTSRPMPRVVAEMLLVLGVRGGHGRVRSTGIVEADIRDHRPTGSA